MPFSTGSPAGLSLLTNRNREDNNLEDLGAIQRWQPYAVTPHRRDPASEAALQGIRPRRLLPRAADALFGLYLGLAFHLWEGD